MKTEKGDFTRFATQMLSELIETAIKLDMPVFAYLLAMAVQEAVESDDVINCPIAA